MTDLARLSLEIETAQVKRAKTDLDRLSESANRAEREAAELAAAGRQMDSSLGGVAGAAKSAAGALVGLGAGALAVQVIRTADEYQELSNRLGLVTRGAEDLARVQEQLIGVAGRQRKGIAEVTSLYISASNAAGELGASQQEILKFTEGVSAALTVNGTSVQAAAGALLQLGQAIGGSVIQAQEFNSLIDGARPLLQAVANNLDEAGGSVSRLKQLVNEGRVTSEAFFRAAVAGADDLIAKASGMQTTVGGAFTVIGNSTLTLVGQIDQLTGTSSAISSWGVSFAGALDQVAEQMAFVRRTGGDLFTFLAGNSEVMRLLFGVAPQRTLNKAYRKDAIQQRVDELGAQLDGGLINRRDLRYNAALERGRLMAELGRMNADPYASGTRRPANEGGGGYNAAAIEATRLRLESEEAAAASRMAAGAIDAQAEARRRHIEAMRDEAQTAEGLTLIRERQAATDADTLRSLADQNQALRNEIELMGLNADAINAVEIARTSSNRALKEEELIMAQNAGASEDRLMTLRGEIQLLKERENLLRQRGEKIDSGQGQQVFSDFVRTEDKRQISTAFEDSITEGLLNGFRNGRSLADVFLDELKAQFAKTILQPIIAPIAQQGNSVISDIIGLVGSFFSAGSGGGPIGFSSVAGISGGRASGGSVEAGASYIVGERGPEILRMGKSAGYVTPTEATGGGKSVTITYAPQIAIDSRSDRAAVASDVDQLLRRNNAQLMAQLKAAGVV